MRICPTCRVYRTVLEEHVETIGLEVDAWHASPPCQRHTAGTRAISRDIGRVLIGHLSREAAA